MPLRTFRTIEEVVMLLETRHASYMKDFRETRQEFAKFECEGHCAEIEFMLDILRHSNIGIVIPPEDMKS